MGAREIEALYRRPRQCLPNPPGRRKKLCRFHPKPGSLRLVVPVQRGARKRAQPNAFTPPNLPLRIRT
jgi:hypothetical protein